MSNINQPNPTSQGNNQPNLDQSNQIAIEVNTPMTADSLIKLTMILGRNRMIKSLILGGVFAAIGIFIMFVNIVLGIVAAACGVMLMIVNPIMMRAKVAKSAKAAFKEDERVVCNVVLNERIEITFTRLNKPQSGKKNELREKLSYTQILKAQETKDYFVLTTQPMHGILLSKQGIVDCNIDNLRQLLKDKLKGKFVVNKFIK